jgi:YbbR domain-containing protein
VRALIAAILRTNVGSKIVSVAIALVLWFVVLGSRNVEAIKEVPIEIVTANDMVVENEVPDRVSFRLTGPKAFLRAILDRPDAPIRVNLAGSKPGLVTYRFFSDNIRVPIGVKVTSVSPSAILVKVEERASKSVPVKIETRGEPAAGYQVTEAVADPPTAVVRGPRSRVDRVHHLVSNPVDVSEATGSVERAAAIDLERLGLQLEGPPPTARVRIDPVSANFKIKNVTVQVRTPHKTRVSDRIVTVYVRARPGDLESLDESKVFAEIDLRGKPKGKYSEKVQVKMPGNIGLVRVIPEIVQVTLY